MTQQPKKLLDQVRDAIRLKHYAYSTEKTYVYWAKRFVLYHNKRHPLEMGEKEISEFLTYLAVEENVAASTQNQALSALLLLYREVLRKDRDLPLELVMDLTLHRNSVASRSWIDLGGDRCWRYCSTEGW